MTYEPPMTFSPTMDEALSLVETPKMLNSKVVVERLLYGQIKLQSKKELITEEWLVLGILKCFPVKKKQ